MHEATGYIIEWHRRYDVVTILSDDSKHFYAHVNRRSIEELRRGGRRVRFRVGRYPHKPRRVVCVRSEKSL